MLTDRSEHEDPPLPVEALDQTHRNEPRVFGDIGPQSIGTAATAVVLIGVFLSGLFQLRSYRSQPIVTPAGPYLAPRATVVEATPARATTDRRVTGADSRLASRTGAAIPPAVRPDVPDDSERESNRPRRTEEDEDEEDEDKNKEERGRGKGHGKHGRSKRQD